MRQAALWTWPLRAALAAMWLVHGLEKFGLKWPPLLAGGTHSVRGMLGLMAEETPIAPLQWLIDTLMLPVARLLQYPVGVLEICLAAAIASGLLLRWATLVGALMQTLFWLGFLSLDWPMQYPLVIALHLGLGLGLWFPRPGREAGLLVVRLALAGVWLLASGGSEPFRLAIALLTLAGLGSRLLSLPALALALAALSSQPWGDWPWTYYLTAAAHLALLLGGAAAPALAQVLPPRFRRFAA